MFPVIRNGGEPRGGWVEAGRQARAEGRRVLVGESIGYLGFYAGPAVHVVDQLALCDPLLARMEVPDKNHWRIGHFKRNLPAGYVETLEGGANRIANPRLAGLYDVLEVITRGPLWRRDRFREIVKINLGFYRDRMRETGGSGPWQ
jgi:arabinofuranosyltransferase